MPSLTSHPRYSAKFLSRKKQWRLACGAGARRSRTLPRHEPETTTISGGTRSADGRAKYRARGPPIPEVNSRAAPMPSRQPASSTNSATYSTSGTCSNGDITEKKRRVRFDSTIQVMLVPTRHELKSKGLVDDGADEAVRRKRDNDDNGIWWTMRDCFGFRKAYRRQIIASGLKCTSLLCPTSVVFLIGAEDEEDAKKEDKISSNRSQPRHPYRKSPEEKQRGRPKVPRSRSVCPWDSWGSSSTSLLINDI